MLSLRLALRIPYPTNLALLGSFPILFRFPGCQKCVSVQVKWQGKRNARLDLYRGVFCKTSVALKHDCISLLFRGEVKCSSILYKVVN